MSPGAGEPARLAAVRATGLLDSAAEEAFDRLAGMARTLLGAPFAFLTVVDDQRSFWKSCLGIAEGGPRQNELGESFCQYVVTSGEPLVLGDVRLDARTRDNPSIRSMGVVAWAGFPVHTPDGHVLGTLCVVDTVVRHWTPADVEILESLAAIATREVALRAAVAESTGALLVAQAATAAAETARAREQLFSRIGELLTAGLDLPAVWRAVVRLAVPALADYAFVHSVTARDSLTVQYLLHRDPAKQAQAEELVIPFPRRLTDRIGPGHVTATGTSQLVPVLADVPGELTPGQRAATSTLGTLSTISVPLRARGGLIGVLTVARIGNSAPYTSSDVELVEAICARAALALDNALAYDQERNSSLQLQEALLPALLPESDHVRLASRYLPAGIRQVVGGDWYDAFIDRRGATTLVIGDVAGHDIGAAAAMGQLRAMTRMAGHDGTLSPAEVLTAVDTATQDLGTSVFTTALIAHVDRGEYPDPPGSLVLTWSSAGHLPAVLVDAGGRAQLLDHHPDRALGLDLEDIGGLRRARRDNRTTLPPGATLILYTDGLIERRGHDLDTGMQQLLDVAAELHHLPLQQLCDALLEQLQPDRSDDVALLALRSLPGDPPCPADAGAALISGCAGSESAAARHPR